MKVRVRVCARERIAVDLRPQSLCPPGKDSSVILRGEQIPAYAWVGRERFRGEDYITLRITRAEEGERDREGTEKETKGVCICVRARETPKEDGRSLLLADTLIFIGFTGVHTPTLGIFCPSRGLSSVPPVPGPIAH